MRTRTGTRRGIVGATGMIVIVAIALGACADGTSTPDTPGGDGGLAQTDPCAEWLHSASTLFCDGFESPSLAGWSVEAPTGTASRTTSRSHAGLAALETATTVAAPDGGAFAIARWSPISTGELWARAHYYVPDSFDASLLSILSFSGEAEPRQTIALTLGSDDASSVWLSDPEQGIAGAMSIPRDRWFCVQAHIVVSDAGAIELDIDGARAITAGGLDTRLSGGISQVSVGIPWTAPEQGAAAALVDDVAVATTPLPCAPD